MARCRQLHRELRLARHHRDLMRTMLAIEQLEAQLAEIEAVRQAGLDSIAHQTWRRTVESILGERFGADSAQLRMFSSIQYSPPELKRRHSTELRSISFAKGLVAAESAIRGYVAELRRAAPTTLATSGSIPEVTHVVIVCALHRPELQRLIAVTSERWERMPSNSTDPHVYHSSSLLTTRGRPVQVVAAAPNEMGLTASGVLAAKMVWRFRPKIVMMVGILAGVKSDKQGYGDVVAADQTLDYGSGKIRAGGEGSEFLPDPRPVPVSTRAAALLKQWELEQSAVGEIERAWIAGLPNTRLKLHVGPVASGASVLDSAARVDEITRHYRKVVGVEMEAFAVHSACRDTISPPPEFLCFKAICDFATDKNDGWQAYAAFTAASLSIRFLRAEYESLLGV